jgi:hypothetical protein
VIGFRIVDVSRFGKGAPLVAELAGG